MSEERPAPPVGRGDADQSFRRSERILARRDFLRARSKARKIHSRHLIALVLPSPTGRRRLGLTVSTKVGNAVARNQVKRWLREIYRREKDQFPPRIDLVLIAKQGAPEAGYHALHTQLLEIAGRLRGGG